MYCDKIAPRKMVKNKRDLRYSPARNRSSRRSVSKPNSEEKVTTTAPCANVKVIIRVRPPNQKEQQANSRTIVQTINDGAIIFDPREESQPFFFHGVQQRYRDLLKKTNKNIHFNFDKVFGSEANNSEVFAESTQSLIGNLMEGYNCSVFAYGATGSGKTYTMLGRNDNPGITILTVTELFNQIKKLESEREFDLGITYLEIYNETVKDLLNPGGPLHLREDENMGMCVVGIEVVRIKSPEELFSLLEKGNAKRTQHPTDANAESSRSHAVFQVYVSMVNRINKEQSFSKLSMIDLAGSERASATGCKGLRFIEGANINKSLLALANCINALADGQRHVPYRDSKLTRLLKDSLGGNCQTIMIANISPSSLNYEDTYNTLKYALRAKKIKSNMKKNILSCNLTIPQYIQLVDRLNKEIEKLKVQLKAIEGAKPATVTNSSQCGCSEEKNSIKQDKEEKDPAWRSQLKELLQEKSNIRKQIHRLINSEEMLHYKIKFKETTENLIRNICVNEEQLESGRNRLMNTIGTYQKQLNEVLSQLNKLKKENNEIQLKIETLQKENELAEDDIIFIKNNFDYTVAKYQIQVEHTKNVIELYQTEMNCKDQVMYKITEDMRYYFQLLRGHGYITDDMLGAYQNIVRKIQGIKSVHFEIENLPDDTDAKKQDSGISVSAKESLELHKTMLLDEISGKRSSIKRKLYDTELKPINTTIIKECSKSESEQVCSSNTSCNSSKSNLNETITLPSAMNTNSFNSTFCIHDKESRPKKKALTDRSNTVSAENMLRKVYKTTGTKKTTINGKSNAKMKYYSALSRGQRFPLRKNENNHGESTSNCSTKIANCLNINNLSLPRFQQS